MKQVRPFFIIGTQRGGTTLLRLMVSHHKALAVPPESHFLIPIIKKFGKQPKLNKTEQRAVLEMILHQGRFDTWNTSPLQLQKQFAQFKDEMGLADLINQVFHQEIESIGKKRWGDKTPEYLAIFEQLAVVFPTAQFVFLIRDGRDVVKSLENRGWQGWSVYQRSKYWANAMRKINQFRSSHVANALLVKYESLVLNPEKELHRICSFLEEPFDKGMLEYYREADQHITTTEKNNQIHTKLNRLPQASDLEKWKTTESKSKIFYTEAIMHRELREMGYSLSFFKPGNLIHQGKKWGYLFASIALNALHFGYHGILGDQLRNQLRNSGVGVVLRKMVRRA